MKFILGLVVLLLATTGFAADVSVAGNRADVTTKFSGFVQSVGINVEKSTASVTIMEGGCHPYYQSPGYLPGEKQDGSTLYPHPHKPGHDCGKNAMKIGLDLKVEGDKMLYDFFSHAHGGVTVVTSNGKIAFVKTESRGGMHGPIIIDRPIPIVP
jgi:hypothetical protein